ncbi:MAG: flavodoxin family protein [Candidatus Omnitrophica bacterium]|nr:flavodoxin family protein [Candidatus Omnitrophota bacterium]
MAKKILIVSASPVKDGNTTLLIGWFCEGLGAGNVDIEIIRAASLKYKSNGCTACRSCQKIKEYECVIKDEASIVLKKMAAADVIVMATPLYFFGASAQLKLIFDRMFSLYKWDNDAGAMQTVLKGKTLALIASAFEDVGLDALKAPFCLTAEYTGMKFESLLIPNAGVSGAIKNNLEIKNKAIAFGRKISGKP